MYLHVPTAGEEYDAAVDSLGSLMEDVARRVTKAVQHYEDVIPCLDAVVVDSESLEIIWGFLLYLVHFGSMCSISYIIIYEYIYIYIYI